MNKILIAALLISTSAAAKEGPLCVNPDDDWARGACAELASIVRCADANGKGKKWKDAAAACVLADALRGGIINPGNKD